MSKPGLTDADRAILRAHADNPNADDIRASIRAREHAERSSRFDWAADPDREYCGRCGVTLDEVWVVTVFSHQQNCCQDCFAHLRRRAVRGKIDLQVEKRPNP